MDSSGAVAEWGLNAAEVQAARETFALKEPRDLFYRAATELISSALDGKSSLTTAECLAVLLQTWNKAYYQYRPFDHAHFKEIDALLESHGGSLHAFRRRSIKGFSDTDEKPVTAIFDAFDRVLGPVGAAKCLHLLAPRFYPLWDRAIADGYQCALKTRGMNATAYLRFMRIARDQAEYLCKQTVAMNDPLKAIDEYNYCKYTKKWL